MNHMLPILSVAIGLLAAIPLAAGQSSQVVYGREVVSDEPGLGAVSPGATTSGTPTGQELVAQAVQALLLRAGIEAKTRQRVNIFDQQLVGSGMYLQLAQGPKLLLQLDLKLRLGDQPSSLRQISDGDFLWILQYQADQTSVSRVNLRRLRDAAARAEPTIVPPSFWMALGGVPRLLSQLEENFQFRTPQPLMVAKLPVWSVEGEWKPEVLARLLPDQKDDILAGRGAHLEALPQHLPHGVTLILGRDQIIPLFPYSFSFYRDESTEGNATPRRVPLVTWELFEVRTRTDLDPSQFEFRPNDQQVKERTDEYIERLQAAAKILKSSSAPGR